MTSLMGWFKDIIRSVKKTEMEPVSAETDDLNPLLAKRVTELELAMAELARAGTLERTPFTEGSADRPAPRSPDVTA